MLVASLFPAVRLSAGSRGNRLAQSREGERLHSLVRRLAESVSHGYIGCGQHGVGYFGESYGPPFMMVMRCRRYCFPQ